MEHLHQLQPNFQQNNISPLQPLNIRMFIKKRKRKKIKTNIQGTFQRPKINK
jgi:hypothetical protein